MSTPAIHNAHRMTKEEVTVLTPEKRLAWAVVMDAYSTLLKNALGRSVRERHLRDETMAWLRSPDTEWVFSFVSCCHMVGVEPGYVLRLILADYEKAKRAPLTPRRPRRDSGRYSGQRIY